MGQLFHPRANAISKATILALLLAVVILILLYPVYSTATYRTGVGEIKPQPVPFSHEHHVRGIGIDCRYCHHEVEESGFAGIPSTKVCMTCHSQIWSEAPMLAPVRESWKSGLPLQWVRVHDLPDFSYFNHSIHVQKGIGCVTCHGRVDRMPMMQKTETLQMQWCLECHRNPAKFIRPQEEVFNMNYHPPENQEELGGQLIEEYNIPVERLTDCYVCHR